MHTHARGAVAGLALMAMLLLGCTPTEAPQETRSPEPTRTVVSPSPSPSPTPDPTPEPPPLAAHAVNAGHPAAVEAGMDVLAAGGTAVDAAVATALAVSVVEPFASGIGGGGSAIVVPFGEDPVGYDYREVVPADGIVPASNSGVPGLLAGLDLLHEEHGVLPWADLVAPAIALARDGSPTSQMLADQLRSTRGRTAARGLGHFYPGGRALSAGEPLVQARLAEILQMVADGGAEAFYGGPLGQSLAAQVVGLDQASLEAYGVQVSDPPSGDVAGYEVVSASPALPGAALIQMLQIAEGLDIASAPPGSAEYVQDLSAAWGYASRTVETELGDPDFVDVPVDAITDATANRAVAANIAAGTVRTSARSLKTSETTHLTIVDQDGLVVTMTNTLTNFWGSGQYVDGYFMNNQLVRFSVGSGGQNTPEAGRRSVSWGMPTVVLDDQGRPVLALGSPGGVRIPMILGNVLVRWALHGQSLEEAVASDRFYTVGREVQFENLPPGDVGSALRSRGYTLTGPVPPEYYVFGSVQALAIDWEGGGVTGAVDTRREAALAVGP